MTAKKGNIVIHKIVHITRDHKCTYSNTRSHKATKANKCHKCAKKVTLCPKMPLVLIYGLNKDKLFIELSEFWYFDCMGAVVRNFIQ